MEEVGGAIGIYLAKASNGGKCPAVYKIILQKKEFILQPKMLLFFNSQDTEII